MSLSLLRSKLNKLFFLNNLIMTCGAESLEALVVLEDEIKELEQVYDTVEELLENYI